MDDPWKEIDKRLTEAKNLYLKYTKDNPKLKSENELLKKERFDLSREVANLQGELENLNTQKNQVIIDTDSIKEKANIYATDTIASAQDKINELNKEYDLRIKSLGKLQDSLDKREEDIKNQEKESDTRFKALEESTKLLQKQAKEIEDATRVLNTKAIDNQHDEDVLNQKSQELDDREAFIAKAEEDIGERIKTLESAEKRSQNNFEKSKQLLYSNDLTRLELEKRTKLLDNKEKKINKQEIELRKRTDSFVDSLRLGKMV